MIEYNGISLDGMSVELTTAPPRKPRYAFRMKRRSFYRRHKLAVWLTFDVVVFGLFCLAMSNNARILWALSDPIMRLLP